MVSEHGRYAVALRGGDPPRWMLAYRYQAGVYGDRIDCARTAAWYCRSVSLSLAVKKTVYAAAGGDTQAIM